MRPRTLLICGTAVVALAAATGAVPVATAAPPTGTINPGDWRTYGGSAHHAFTNATGLNTTNVHTLAPTWFFRTGDAVTANPVVVGNRVFVGSWDGNFYAIDKATGTQAWKFAVDAQPAVNPRPGPFLGRDFDPSNPASFITSDGGLITSSTWYEPASVRTQGKNLVIFGGGYTLYALNADTGALVWKHAYTGLPEAPPDPAHDEARIFSSPIVDGNKVIFGVSSDGQDGHRGYVVAANLQNGNQVWRFETSVDATGAALNNGCGGVWSSPTLIESQNVVVVDVADCNFKNLPQDGIYNEKVLALRVNDGAPAWVFDPQRNDPDCDWDFGATANYGTLADGTAFLGVGGKDGTYYSIDPATGTRRWATNVVFGGFAGGFIATSAFDGTRAYGATALGDFGRFENFPNLGCSDDPRNELIQEPSMHAFNATGGAVAWRGNASQSFGATTVAGGMTFVGTGITRTIQIRDAATGTVIHQLPLPAANDSGVSVVGKSIFFGTGSSEQSTPAGVYSYTALG